VRNTADNDLGDRVCFRVEVKCIKPFTPGATCVPQQSSTDAITVGGYDLATGDPVTGNNNWFKSLLGEFDLKDYEGDVYDAIMLVRGVKPDSYAMEINVYKEHDNKDCGSGGYFDPQDAPYASKTFVLKVV